MDDRADPYAGARAAGHAVLDFGAGEFVLVTGYDDVRAAARDWRGFTSDTPFEVPIPAEHDLRPVRQLPIECDPPDHTDYRMLVADRFSRSAVEAHSARVGAVVDSVIDGALAEGVLDVIPDLGVPVVNGRSPQRSAGPRRRPRRGRGGESTCSTPRRVAVRPTTS